jgi:hypothetical protein
MYERTMGPAGPMLVPVLARDAENICTTAIATGRQIRIIVVSEHGRKTARLIEARCSAQVIAAETL